MPDFNDGANHPVPVREGIGPVEAGYCLPSRRRGFTRAEHAVLGACGLHHLCLAFLLCGGRHRSVSLVLVIVALPLLYVPVGMLWPEPSFWDFAAGGHGLCCPPAPLQEISIRPRSTLRSLDAFGPASSLVGYTDLAAAVRLASRGGGSLVATVCTNDPDVARELVPGNPFFSDNVTHGYLLLVWGAGLFVESALGPVLAGYGTGILRLITPVAGDFIRVTRAGGKITPRKTGGCRDVAWDVVLANQNDEIGPTTTSRPSSRRKRRRWSSLSDSATGIRQASITVAR